MMSSLRPSVVKKLLYIVIQRRKARPSDGVINEKLNHCDTMASCDRNSCKKAGQQFTIAGREYNNTGQKHSIRSDWLLSNLPHRFNCRLEYANNSWYVKASPICETSQLSAASSVHPLTNLIDADCTSGNSQCRFGASEVLSML